VCPHGPRFVVAQGGGVESAHASARSHATFPWLKSKLSDEPEINLAQVWHGRNRRLCCCRHSAASLSFHFCCDQSRRMASANSGSTHARGKLTHRRFSSDELSTHRAARIPGFRFRPRFCQSSLAGRVARRRRPSRRLRGRSGNGVARTLGEEQSLGCEHCIRGKPSVVDDWWDDTAEGTSLRLCSNFFLRGGIARRHSYRSSLSEESNGSPLLSKTRTARDDNARSSGSMNEERTLPEVDRQGLPRNPPPKSSAAVVTVLVSVA
jgi:hypothetical protein